MQPCCSQLNISGYGHYISFFRVRIKLESIKKANKVGFNKPQWTRKVKLKAINIFLKDWKERSYTISTSKRNSLTFFLYLYLSRTYDSHISNFLVLISTISRNLKFKPCPAADFQYRLYSFAVHFGERVFLNRKIHGCCARYYVSNYTKRKITVLTAIVVIFLP